MICVLDTLFFQILRTKGSLFNSNLTYTLVYGRSLLLFLIASLILDPYLVMLSVKQEGIKYHFLSLWYDLTGN